MAHSLAFGRTPLQHLIGLVLSDCRGLYRRRGLSASEIGKALSRRWGLSIATIAIWSSVSSMRNVRPVEGRWRLA